MSDRHGTTASSVANPVRIHALEALRSWLLLLGIIAHAVLVLRPTMSRSDGTSAAMLYRYIHVFRLPAYFLVAGYFAAWLYERDGLRGFVISRFKRVTSVLLVAQLAIAVTYGSGACGYCSVQGEGWLAHGWLYLWFLCYLALLSHLTVSVVALVNRYAPLAARAVSSTLARREAFWVLLVFGFLALAVLPGVFGGDGTFILDDGIVPNPSLLVGYGLFFVFGWTVFQGGFWCQIRSGLAWQLPLSVLLGVLVVGASGPIACGFGAQFVFSGLAWSATLSCISVAFAFASKANRLWRYLDDASFWSYLWHLPIILVVTVLIRGLGLNGWPAILAVTTLALALCLGTYQLVARRTIVGLWLSGRRRGRRFQSAARVAATQKPSLPTIG